MNSFDLLDIESLKQKYKYPEEIAFGLLSGLFIGISNTFNQYNNCSDCCYHSTIEKFENNFDSLDEIATKVKTLQLYPKSAKKINSNWQEYFLKNLREIIFMSNLGTEFYKEGTTPLYCFDKNLENIINLIDFLTKTERTEIFDISIEHKFPIHFEWLFITPRQIYHIYLDNTD